MGSDTKRSGRCATLRDVEMLRLGASVQSAVPSLSPSLSQWLKGDAPEKVLKLAFECNTGLEHSREDAKRQRYDCEFCLQAGHDAPSRMVSE